MQLAPIQWSYTGVADPLCGTGATRAERMLAYGFAAFFTAIILAADFYRDVPIAEGWRVALLAFFAFDIAGGAVANMLNSCKRFYHGQLQPGDRLPTEAELSKRFGVARTVVREAISLLRYDGIVDSRRGVGAFVTDASHRSAFRISPM